MYIPNIVVTPVSDKFGAIDLVLNDIVFGDVTAGGDAVDGSIGEPPVMDNSYFSFGST